MKIEKYVEFDRIKEMWRKLAVTAGAGEKIQEAAVCLNEGELRKLLKDTADGRELIEKLGMPPLQNLEEIKEVLNVADKGDCLSPHMLERVEGVLAVTKRLKDYLKRGKAYGNSLAYYEENLDAGEQLREEISRQIRNGMVDDYASKELSRIRKQIVKCQEQMKQKAEQIISSNKECMADSYCTQRNGRICVPVKKEYKLKIAGSVIDKSATGSTFFIEPAGVARYYEELQSLRLEEENEVYCILYTLTAGVAEAAPCIRENIVMMEKLDFIFSKGKLSIDLKGTAPSINTENRIVLKNARHPLMDPETNVPLQLELGGQVQGIVITGPNTGGKTVALKTVMLNCIMAQCGLHITCEEADIGMRSSYLGDIGDGQSIEENLSTFSAHIKNVLEILSEVNRDSLVIMDELGSGTDPAEGMGIAVAILEELKKSGALFLATTHYPEVKEYADRTPKLLNARMTFDRESLQPTYQLVLGEAGQSCAFYIADRLGMPVEMLRTAIREAYGEQAVEKYHFQNQQAALTKRNTAQICKTRRAGAGAALSTKYKRGDSVMIYPDKKIGIVCEPVNEKGILRVQLPGRKIWINHKRVKLHVAAEQLYPEDYDFSILFETVRDRKVRHDMERKYTEEVISSLPED